MSTDSGVNDLIRSFQTRRLDTDPGDAFLFQPSAAAREPVRAVPPPRSLDRAPVMAAPIAAPMPAPMAPARSIARAPARSLDHAPKAKGHSPFTLAPARPIDQVSRAPSPAYPKAARDVVWPWIAATIIAGVVGLFGASYLWRTIEGDEASVSLESVAPPAPAPVVAPFMAPPVVEPAPSPAAAPASTTDALAADAIVPPIAPPSAEPAATSTPHKKVHRKGHAKAKRTSAKHAKTSR